MKNIKTQKTSFQIMTGVLKKNEHPTLDEKRRINPFFFCRYLSNHPKSVRLSNIFNIYYNEIPIEIQYDISKIILLAENKIKFIQFPKKENDDSIIISNICKYYNVSIETANEYLNVMDDSERNRFKNIYNEGVVK